MILGKYGRVLGIVNGIGQRSQAAFFLPLSEQFLVTRARRRQRANRHAKTGGLVALLGAISGKQRVFAAHAGEQRALAFQVVAALDHKAAVGALAAASVYQLEGFLDHFRGVADHVEQTNRVGQLGANGHQARGLAGAGGYLLPPANSGVLDLRTQLHAPRLSSSTEADAEAKAAQNAAAINALLQRLPRPGSGRDVLFVNDVTLYLQAGFAADLLGNLGKADFTTLVVNGYWGQRLGDSALSRREREQTRRLREHFANHGQVLDLGGEPQGGSA